MNLKNTIQQNIIKAMKAREKQKLESLRYLNAQIKDKEIEQRGKELTDKDIISIISSLLKKLEESLAIFGKAGRTDLVHKNQEEIALLKTYLPTQLSDEELDREVAMIIKENPNISQPGPLIGLAVKKLSGKAENKRISTLVLSKLEKE